VVRNELKIPLRTRWLRIVPRSWNNHIGLRVELYGCWVHKRNGLHSQAVLRRALTWTCGGWRRFTNLKNREYYTASAKIRTLQTLWDFAIKTLPILNLVNMLMKYFFLTVTLWKSWYTCKSALLYICGTMTR